MNNFDYERSSLSDESLTPPRKTTKKRMPKTPKKRMTPTPRQEEIVEVTLDESNIAEYLRENPDNIIVMFGETLNCTTRSSLENMINNPQHVYTGSDGKRYVQIIGRYLIDYKDVPLVLDPSRSIYNFPTLVNVVNVYSESNPSYKHNRSVYEIQGYTVDDLVASL